MSGISGARLRIGSAFSGELKLDLESDGIAGYGGDVAQGYQGKRHQRSDRVPHPTR